MKRNDETPATVRGWGAEDIFIIAPANRECCSYSLEVVTCG